MTFTRRVDSVPSLSFLTAIEGIVIVDLPPPVPTNGVGTNLVALVGEFADMTYATKVSTTGVVSTYCSPQLCAGAQDFVNKFGGFDSTIGDFGDQCGNGYHAISNKSFGGGFVVAPINLASAEAVRAYRELPTNASTTNPSAVVPAVGAGVDAGTEFYTGSSKVRLGARISFSASPPIASGVDGLTYVGHTARTSASGSDGVTTSATATSHTLTSAGATFTTDVAVGDFLVVGTSTGYLITEITDGTHVKFARLDGASFNPGAATGLTFAIYARTKAATSHTLTCPGGDFVNAGVRVGDALVIGVIGTTSANTADTFRVTSVAATALGFEAQNGASVTITAEYALPYRVHPGTDADTGGVAAIATASGFTLPARPTVATISANATLTPTSPAATASATVWEPLSGLTMIASASGITYTAAIQAPNATTASGLRAAYLTAIQALERDESPLKEISAVWSARKDGTIAGYLKNHVVGVSGQGRGRMAVVSPALSVYDFSSIQGAAWPGVAAIRHERVIYCWPGVQTYVPQAENISIEVGDATTVTTGVIDETSDGWMASLLSNLGPERNPGQNEQPVRAIMQYVLGFQRAPTPITPDINRYTALRQLGVCSPRFDSDVGPAFQSGLTSSLTAGKKNISRRRMADFTQDSIVQILKPFSKLPMTPKWRTDVQGAIEGFFQPLGPECTDKSKQLYAAVDIDMVSGNTAEMEAAGAFNITVVAKTFATADFIQLTTGISENQVVKQ